MKKLILALIAILGALGLALAACRPPEEQGMETTTTAIERTETKEVTTEVTQEVTKEATREATEIPVESTIEPTKEVVVQATKQTDEEGIEIVLWTTEREADGGLQFVQSLADDYTTFNPNVTVEVTDKDGESLREDILTAGLTGSRPDLLWTVDDHVRPFVDDELIIPLDDMFDFDKYVESASAAVQLGGQTWGVPINSGGHLMLIYNKDLIDEPPQTTDELIEMGLELTTNSLYGLVYNQTDPQWLVPWLAGFTGSVFAEDGTTPTLNTEQMVNTLQFLYDIKSETPIVPEDSDYDGAHVLFSRGRAAMIIDGDWSLAGYRDTFAGALGVARIPRVSATGEWPRPYISGSYLMFPVNPQEDPAKLDAVMGFAEFVTSAENQALLVTELDRLPTLKEALEAPPIVNNPVVKGSADQMTVGRPVPTVREMRCNWNAMRPEMQAVLAGDKSPKQAAADMQEAAEICIENLEDR